MSGTGGEQRHSSGVAKCNGDNPAFLAPTVAGEEKYSFSGQDPQKFRRTT